MLTYDGGPQLPTDAGSYSVAGTFAGNQNYSTAVGSGTLLIDPAHPTIVVDGVATSYDGAPHAATGTVTGVAGVVLGTPTFTYNGSATVPVDAGWYTVPGSFAGSRDYSLATAGATVTITSVTPTMSIAGGNYAYDGTSHPATGTVTGIGGAVIGTPTFTYNGSANIPVDAGSYTVAGSFAGNPNYLPATSSPPATITIAPATAVVSVSSGSFTYDGAPHPATGTVTGLHGGTIGAPTFTYDGAAAAPIDAGWYSVVASFAGDQNYLPSTSAPAMLTILQAPATIMVAGGSFAYDGTAHAATGSVVGIGGAAIAVPTLTYNGAAAVPVGRRVVQRRRILRGRSELPAGDECDGHADDPPGDADGDGCRRGVHVRWESARRDGASRRCRRYRGRDSRVHVQRFVDGTRDGRQLFRRGRVRRQSKLCGCDERTCHGHDRACIHRPHVVGAGRDHLRHHAWRRSTQRDCDDVGIVIPYSPSAGTVLAAGLHTLSATFLPTDTTDYNGASTWVTIMVGPAPLTIRAASQSVAYGSGPGPLSASYSGFVNGDSASSLTTAATLSTTATALSHAGTYTVLVGGATNANYAISFIAGAVTVTPAPLTITANDASMVVSSG